jgi:pantothenate kinase type III
MIRSLIQDLKRDLKIDHLPVVATGGYAELITQTMPEITSVHPQLTLEGLRLLHPQRRI